MAILLSRIEYDDIFWYLLVSILYLNVLEQWFSGIIT